MIPKYIHFIWIGGGMPDWVKFNIAEFKRLNPCHTVMVHGEEILFPELKSFYSRIEEIPAKSDILRLCALYRYGGWYFDTDFWAFRPVDDIEKAYQLDGSRLFLSKQQENRNPEHTIANGIMAIGDQSDIISDLIDESVKVQCPCGTELGPRLVKRYYSDNKFKVVLGDAQWFFPADFHDAVKHYERIKNGYNEIALTMCPETAGQSPFAMHLWAGGSSVIGDLEKDKTLSTLLNPKGKRLAGVILNEVQARMVHLREDHPMRCIADGLVNLGYQVEVRTDECWPCFSSKPELIVVWNGMREPLCHRVDSAEREGIPVYRVEHGWFDRKQYHQCDPRGILHWSSIVKRIRASEPPSIYKSRFEKVWTKPLRPVKVNKASNKILVIGQTVGDTQLSDSEIQAPLQIDKAVCRAIEGLDLTAEFRPHPLDHGYKDRNKYLPTAENEPLEDAIAKARFIITINSNTGVESLALGCPVLCFGPATYEQVGAAWKTTLHDLRMNIQNMSDFVADQDATRNYLYWLAGNQWSLDEFTDGIPFIKEVA